jgi:dolichol-phosphate mannosyltransferase
LEFGDRRPETVANRKAETLPGLTKFGMKFAMKIWAMRSQASFGVTLIQRYGKFCVVGGTGMLVDMGMLWLMVSLLGWNLSLGKVLAAESAIVNNFLWNDRWTFRARRSDTPWRSRRLKRFLKFNLICLTGIVWSVLLINLQVYGLRLNVFLANFVAITLVSLWNFFMSERFGWSHG